MLGVFYNKNKLTNLILYLKIAHNFLLALQTVANKLSYVSVR